MKVILNPLIVNSLNETLLQIANVEFDSSLRILLMVKVLTFFS